MYSSIISWSKTSTASSTLVMTGCGGPFLSTIFFMIISCVWGFGVLGFWAFRHRGAGLYILCGAVCANIETAQLPQFAHLRRSFVICGISTLRKLRELRDTRSLRNCGAVLLTAGFYTLNTAETAGTARYPQFAQLRRSFMNCGILQSQYC